MDKCAARWRSTASSEGVRVRKLREARGWSIETLAQKAGVSVKTVGRIERGKTEDPRASTIQRASASRPRGCGGRDPRGPAGRRRRQRPSWIASRRSSTSCSGAYPDQLPARVGRSGPVRATLGT